MSMTAQNEHDEEEDLRHALESAQRDYKEFVYTVSHDLSAPVRHIVSFSEILLEELGGNLTEEQQNYKRLLNEAGQRVFTMMDILLAFSRLNTQPKEQKMVDLATVLSEVTGRLEAEHRQNPDGWQKPQVTMDETARVWAAPDYITDIFMHLLDNAYRYTKEGEAAKVGITQSRQDGYHKFCISDQGKGMGEEEAQHILTLFRRGNVPPDPARAGAGLSLAKKTIETCGGDFHMETKKNEGTKIFFTLPAAD